MENDEIEEFMSDTKSRVSSSLDVNVTLVDSRTWHEKEFARCGGWESWAWETVNGKDFSTRRPFFDGFVVNNSILGRANAQIVNLALDQRRAVLLCEPEKPLSLVKEVVTIDSERWVDGWRVNADPIGA